MTLIRSAHTGEHLLPTVHLHERSEAKLSAFAEALAKRNTELLLSEVERIRAEAADQTAEQRRLLAALSLSVATAEAARERRFAELERDLREQAASAAPEPMPIPRAGNRAPVTQLWPARD